MTLKTLTLAFASTFALVLAACDSGDGDTSGGSTTNTTPTTQTDPTTGTMPTSGDDTTGTPGETTAETTAESTGTPGDTTDATTAGPALSFAADVWDPIFKPACTCHQSMVGSGGLAMGTDAAAAYAAMVGVPSSTGKNYITAGDDAQSYVYDKITGSQGMGSMMPLGGPPLTNEQIQVVIEWILGGANP